VKKICEKFAQKFLQARDDIPTKKMSASEARTARKKRKNFVKKKLLKNFVKKFY